MSNHLSHGMTCKDCSSSFCKYQCIQWKYQPDNTVKGNTLFIVTVTQIHNTYRVDMKSFRMSEQTVHWPGSRNVYLIHPYRKNYATEICESYRAFSGLPEPLKLQWKIIFLYFKKQPCKLAGKISEHSIGEVL